MVDRMSQQPLYAQVVDSLRARILSGELAPGDRVPGELELMQTYNVHRSTIRHALAVLREEGRIRTLPARGSYVTERPRRRRVVSDLTTPRDQRGFYALLAGEGKRPDVRTTVSWGRPPREIGELLGVEPDEEALIRHRIMGAVGEPPMQVATSYFPRAVVDRVPVLEAEVTGPGGMLARLEEAGYAPLWFDEIVTARMATPGERELGLVTEGEPVVLAALGLTYSPEGELLHAMTRAISAQRCELAFRFGAVPKHEPTDEAT